MAHLASGATVEPIGRGRGPDLAVPWATKRSRACHPSRPGHGFKKCANSSTLKVKGPYKHRHQSHYTLQTASPYNEEVRRFHLGSDQTRVINLFCFSRGEITRAALIDMSSQIQMKSFCWFLSYRQESVLIRAELHRWCSP